MGKFLILINFFYRLNISNVLGGEGAGGENEDKFSASTDKGMGAWLVMLFTSI